MLTAAPRVALSFVFALLLVAAGGSASAQQDVPRLSGAVTDQTGEVDTRAAEAAIGELDRERGVQLFALFVRTTGGTAMASYTDRVAEFNGLGGSDALLVVATEDQTYRLWIGDTVADRVSESEQDSLLAREVEPELRSSRWDEAVVAAAEGLSRAAGSSSGSAPSLSPGIGFLFVPLLFFIGLPLLVFWFFKRAIGSVFGGAGPGGGPLRKGERREEQRAPRRSLEELEGDAHSLLLCVDEGLREAEQELAFAEAQFTTTELQEFRAAVESARGRLGVAFKLQQELDDERPESPEGRRQILESIITECEAARGVLQEQFERIAELREFERNVEATQAKLADEMLQVQASVARAEQAMADLQTQAESAWRPVDGNLAEARKRLELAATALSNSRASVEGGDRHAATAEARTAQQALVEGRDLAAAVENLAGQLMEARARLAERLAEAERSVLQASGAQSQAGGQLETIRGQLIEARRLASSVPPDLLTAYQLASHADAAADELLVSVREAEEERGRIVAAVDLEMAAAESAYSRASDFIRARRGSVGSSARTRLSEAYRHIELAREQREYDSQQALSQARRANALAEEAYEAAAEDFGEHQTWGRGGGIDMGGLGGMLPGLIILGGLGGMLGGGFGGGIGGGMRRGGGFGGIGRSMGGGFGGLGGRSRGGRW